MILNDPGALPLRTSGIMPVRKSRYLLDWCRTQRKTFRLDALPILPGSVLVGVGGMGTGAFGWYVGVLALPLASKRLATSLSSIDFPVPGGPASNTFRRASSSPRMLFASAMGVLPFGYQIEKRRFASICKPILSKFLDSRVPILGAQAGLCCEVEADIAVGLLKHHEYRASTIGICLYQAIKSKLGNPRDSAFVGARIGGTCQRL